MNRKINLMKKKKIFHESKIISGVLNVYEILSTMDLEISILPKTYNNYVLLIYLHKKMERICICPKSIDI